jgi:subtilisin
VLVLLLVIASLLTNLPGSAPEQYVLVQLTPDAPMAEARKLLAAGATEVSRSLRAYRLPLGTGKPLAADLRRRAVLRSLELDRPQGTLVALNDPLSVEEWWVAAIGLEGLEPPGPGKPITIIDSGIDISHPEFASRAETYPLNEQEPAGFGGEHGTAVGSLIGAPQNGVGIVGIYPQAVLRSWDAAVGEGTQLTTSEIVRGLEEASGQGPGVINLSLGSDERSRLIEQAVNVAFRRGSLVVAASGNDGERGNALTYPASLRHVLTAGAADRANRAALFSSRSPYVDLVAPGEGVTVASARTHGFLRQSGTSFASPLVAGAAAWVWTLRPELDNTQLFEVMRRSATDLGAPGRDNDTGFGLLNVRNALAHPAPSPDPLEPNDDVDQARPDDAYTGSGATLTTKSAQRAVVSARMDAYEDPRDVYRIWLPAQKVVFVSTGSPVDVNVTVWGPQVESVLRASGEDRLGTSARPGTGNERVRIAAAATGRWAFVDVWRARGVPEVSYNLAVTAR